MRPGIGNVRPGMAVQFKDLDNPFPNRLSLENLLTGKGAVENYSALVSVLETSARQTKTQATKAK